MIVFGGQPGSIEAEITVDLPRPRDRADPAFHAFRDRAMEELGRSSRDRQTPGSDSGVAVPGPQLVIQDEQRP